MHPCRRLLLQTDVGPAITYGRGPRTPGEASTPAWACGPNRGPSCTICISHSRQAIQRHEEKRGTRQDAFAATDEEKRQSSHFFIACNLETREPRYESRVCP